MAALTVALVSGTARTVARTRRITRAAASRKFLCSKPGGRASGDVQTYLRCLLPLVLACGEPSSGTPDARSDGDVTTPVDGAAEDGQVNPVTPEILATGENRPNSLDVHLGAVYWTTDPIMAKGQVKKVSPGGTPAVLSASEDHPTSIDVGPGFIEDTAFWGLDTLLGQVRQIATSGAPPLSAVNINDKVYCLRLDGDRVFFGTRGKLMSKLLTNTSSPATLLQDYYAISAIAVEGNIVVFGALTSTNDEFIVGWVPRTGGVPVTLASGTKWIRDLVIVGSDVVWLENNQIKRVPLAGGSTATVATITGIPWALATQGGKLFVAVNQGLTPMANGRILELDPVSGTQKPLATDQADPRDIAVDTSYIYWANGGLAANTGQIVRLKR